MFVAAHVKKEPECESGPRKESIGLADQVQVKSEPEFQHGDAACIKEEPGCSGSVTRAGLYEDREVEQVESIKEEPGCSDSAARACLYADHEVKDELVLGPECTHQPDVALVVCSWALADADGCVQDPEHTQQQPTLRDCSVRLQRVDSQSCEQKDSKSTTDSHSESKDNRVTHMGQKTNTKNKIYEQITHRDNITSGSYSESDSKDDVYITHKLSYKKKTNSKINPSCEQNTYTEDSAIDSEYVKEDNTDNCKKYICKTTLRDCFVKLKRISTKPVNIRRTLELLNTTSDCDTQNVYNRDYIELCNICGERFALKSDFGKHMMVHIQMPRTEQEAGSCEIEEKNLPMVSDDECSKPTLEPLRNAPQLPLRDCWVKLERIQLRQATNDQGDHTDRDSTDESDEAIHIKNKVLKSDLMKHIMIHNYMPISAEEMVKNKVCPISHDQSPANHGNATLRKKINTSIVHNDEEVNTYICDICGKTFHLKHYLIRHIQLHSLNMYVMTSKIKQIHVEKERPYICDLCGKKFIRKVHLITHMRTHTGQKPYKCEICNMRFKQSGGLIGHKRTHTGERPYSCDICHKTFINSSNLKYHKLVHGGEKPYSCNICKKNYTGSTALRNHILTHLGVLFPCEICDKMFKRADALKKHLLIHEGAKPYSCDICLKDFRQSSTLRLHQRIHNDERPYSCEICKRTFKLLRALKSHKKSHSGEKLYSCDICQSKFARAVTLSIHMRIHTGEKPYSCEICKKEFTQMGHLQTHRIHVHSTLKAYSCNICQKKFKSSGNLRNHKIVHSEVELYHVCQVCNKKFKTSSCLKSHEKIHLEVRLYSCEICRKRFRRSCHLEIHKRMHTGEKPYSCDICNTKFAQSSNLRTHKRSVHLKPFSCEMCQKKFKDMHDLEKHKRRFHAEDKQYSCEICKYTFLLSQNLKRHRLIHLETKPYSCKICKKQFIRPDSLKQHKLIHTSEKP